MYGLINNAVEDMITQKFGEEQWAQIKKKAGLNIEAFVCMHRYSDKVTYDLVAAASEVLKMPPTDFLCAFGKHWIKYIAREGYGELLKMSGKNLPEFLLNLDNLHSHLAASFEGYVPPMFRCTDISTNSLRLHYHSTRPGLSYFVVGLVEGLGEFFNTKTQITIDKTREEGHDHDEFLICFQD